jgi:hypothetical protein
MRLKLIILACYIVILVSPAGLARLGEQSRPRWARPPHVESKIIQLDRNGERGVVPFDHARHETLVNPDPGWSHKAKAGAACSGCHHTLSARGTPQLWRCAACHRNEGDPKNPRNKESDELDTERAFHENCIGCHRATNSTRTINKAPTTCGGCHRPAYQRGSLAPRRQFGRNRDV